MVGGGGGGGEGGQCLSVTPGPSDERGQALCIHAAHLQEWLVESPRKQVTVTSHPPQPR